MVSVSSPPVPVRVRLPFQKRPSSCPLIEPLPTLTHHTHGFVQEARATPSLVYSATSDWQLPLPSPPASCLFMTLTYGTSVGGWRELLVGRVQRVPIRAEPRSSKTNARCEESRGGLEACARLPVCASVSAHSPCRDAARRIQGEAGGSKD